MKYTLAMIATICSAAVSFAADEAKPGKEGKPKHDPAAAFAKLDKDGDNSLSLEEFKAGPMGKKDPAKAEEVFGKKDKDGDKKLTLEEFKAGGPKKKPDGENKGEEKKPEGEKKS